MEMSEVDRLVLQQNHVDILRNLKLDSDILGALYEKETLTEHMVQVIQSRPTDQDKINELLQLLPKRGPEAFNSFLEAIRVHSHWLADKLQQCRHKITQEESHQTDDKAGKEVESSSADKVVVSSPRDKSLTPRSRHLHNSLEEFRKPKRVGENKTENSEKHLSPPKEVIYHDPGVQRNLNHLMAKIKMKLSSKNLREVSFSSPEPATFAMIEKLLDEVFYCLELLETTVSRSYTFLGARDKERNLESYIIDLMDKRRKLEAENREREHQKNKLYQHISKLDNMCRNQKTTQEHLNTEIGRLRESLTKAKEENDEKQTSIDDLRKLIVELEKPRRGRSRFATWKVHNDNNMDEIAKIQKENKLLRTENEQLKQSLAHSLMQIKSDNLKQLAKIKDDSHDHENTDNEDASKTKANIHTGIVFSESAQNMQIRGNLHRMYDHYSPTSQDQNSHQSHGKEKDYSRDVSPSVKGDKRVRFSDYSPTRYYNQRQPLIDSVPAGDLLNGHDNSYQVSSVKVTGGKNVAEENKAKETDDLNETGANNKVNERSQSNHRSRLVKSIGRTRARRSASLNNTNSNRDPNKMTTQMIKKTKIISH